MVRVSSIFSARNRREKRRGGKKRGKEKKEIGSTREGKRREEGGGVKKYLLPVLSPHYSLSPFRLSLGGERRGKKGGGRKGENFRERKGEKKRGSAPVTLRSYTLSSYLRGPEKVGEKKKGGGG